jgi:hypothetical protein
MVWARTKLMIHDDLLRPRPRITIRCEGPHPEKFYKEIYRLLMIAFRVSEDSVQEKAFECKKGEPEKCSAKWEVNKDLDKFSYYWIQVSLDGSVSNGVGKVDITVEGALRTEYPQDSFWQRSLPFEFLRRIWHTTFYTPKRDDFLREGRRIMSTFVDMLKDLARG